jgi:hypothetical protein
MPNYIAIDKEALNEQLGRIADAGKDADLDDDTLEEMSEAMNQINHLMHSIDKPVQIEDHSGAFEVSITKQ